MRQDKPQIAITNPHASVGWAKRRRGSCSRWPPRSTRTQCPVVQELEQPRRYC
ncbi:hypothetical protein PspLS_02937 [Pyricularia sp. CBS 133598]|nr:hypothetical protein PspLS_02937 [Pyricularia sp. CBS 133598]